MATRPRRRDVLPVTDAPLLPYNAYLFKELTLSYTGTLPAKLEAAQAEESLYGWWWRFLKACPQYPPDPCERRNDPVRGAVYEDFGELGDSFQDWWQERGRRLFQEQQMVPLIQLVEAKEDYSGRMPARSLVLELPMNLSREGLMEQLNFILDRFHPGDQLLRHEHSTARRRIYPRPRYRRDKLPMLLAVWTARQREPQPTFWKIGQELGLDAGLEVDDADQGGAASAIRKELSDKVERLYVQAQKLVHNAALGQFPRDDRLLRPADLPSQGPPKR